MSNPTRAAAAGSYVSHGEDFVHYRNSKGAMQMRVDGTGVLEITDVKTTAGVSLNDLQQQVNSAPAGGNTDAGTF